MRDEAKHDNWLIAYLKAAYIPIDTAVEIQSRFRAIFQWWFEFARNLLVVGAFYALAKASDNLLMKVFAWINMGALYAFMFSYFLTHQIRPLPYIKDPEKNKRWNFILWSPYGTS